MSHAGTVPQRTRSPRRAWLLFRLLNNSGEDAALLGRMAVTATTLLLYWLPTVKFPPGAVEAPVGARRADGAELYREDNENADEQHLMLRHFHLENKQLYWRKIYHKRGQRAKTEGRRSAGRAGPKEKRAVWVGLKEREDEREEGFGF